MECWLRLKDILNQCLRFKLLQKLSTYIYLLTNFAIIYFYFQSLRSFKNCNIFILANVYVPHHTDGCLKMLPYVIECSEKRVALKVDRSFLSVDANCNWLTPGQDVKFVVPRACNYSQNQDHILQLPVDPVYRVLMWHKKSHNSSMWRVMVGGGVIMGHLSTNHNSPHERVVAFFVPLYMAQDFPHMYVWMQCLIIDREKNRIVDDMFFSISIAIN